MKREPEFICDHCGITVFSRDCLHPTVIYNEFDLCENCYEDLSKLIKNFYSELAKSVKR